MNEALLLGSLRQHELAEAAKVRMDGLEKEIAKRRTMEDVLHDREQYQKQLQEQTRHFAHQILRAEEEERLRISRELHDQVVQTLIAIDVRLVTLEKEAETLGSNFQKHFALAQQMVEKSVESVYQFSRNLRPPVLDDLGLIPALNSFLKTFTEETGIRGSLTGFSGVETLDVTLLTILYRVAQEALTNVARHAKAQTVEITIQKLEVGMICMRIKDNGQGFSMDSLHLAIKGKRLGLVGMRERLEMVNGTFDIQSVEGQGTTVTALIPIEPRVEGNVMVA